MANPWESDPIVQSPTAKSPWESDPVAAAGPWEKDPVVNDDVTQAGSALGHSFGIGAGQTMRGAGEFLQAPVENVTAYAKHAGAGVQRAAVAAPNLSEAPVDPMGMPTGAAPEYSPERLAAGTQQAAKGTRTAQEASDAALQARRANVGREGYGGAMANLGEGMERAGQSAMAFHQQRMDVEAPDVVAGQKAINDATGFVDTMKQSAQHPVAAVSQGMMSIPDMAVGMAFGSGAGKLARFALEKTAAEAGTKAFQETLIRAASNPETMANATRLARDAQQKVSQEIVQQGSEQYAGLASLKAEAVQSGMSNRVQVQDFVNNQPEDKLRDNPRYRELLKDNDPTMAREMLANELADASVPGASIWTAIAGKLSGAAMAEGKVLANGKISLGGAARNVGKEMLEEGAQNPGENYAQYAAQVQADPSQKFDLGGSIAQGLVGGLVQGAPMHAGGFISSRVSPNPERLAGKTIDSYDTKTLQKYSEAGVLSAPVKEKIDAELERRAQSPWEGDQLGTELQRYASANGAPLAGGSTVQPESSDAGRSDGGVADLVRDGTGVGSDAAAPGPRSESDQPVSRAAGEQLDPLGERDALAASDRPAGVVEQAAQPATAQAMSDLGHEQPTAATNDEHLSAGRQLVKNWQEDRRAQGLSSQAPVLGEITDPKIKVAADAVADALHGVFGTRPVMFHDASNGAPDGFAINGQSYINAANLQQSIHFTAFHETWHVAEQRASQGDTAAQKFVQAGHAIFDMMSEEGKRAYAQKFLFAHEIGNGQSMTIEQALANPKLRSEMVGDFFGHRGEDVKFLRKLAQRAPNSFGGFVRTWIDSLSHIIDAFKAKRNAGVRGVDNYISQLSRAKAIATSSLIEWRQGNPQQAASVGRVSPAQGAFAFSEKDTGSLGNVSDDALGRQSTSIAHKAVSQAAASSDVGHKRRTDGTYVGAPSWVGNSPDKLRSLRSQLRNLAREGESGKDWYANSAKAIRDFIGNDPKEIKKFVGLIAIYSPNSTVPANTSMALNAYFQYKAGMPIKAGFGQANRKAEALMREGKQWSGTKTNSFYSNLTGETNVATLDMWMALAFDYGKKTFDGGPQYAFAEREVQRLAQELGWTAAQTQAAIWVAMKARVEDTAKERKEYELANGIAAIQEKKDPHTGRTVTGHAILRGQEFNHYRTASKFGFDAKSKKESIARASYDFGHALRERQAQMSWEATPGETTGVLPGLLKAPVEKQFEYLVAVEKALQDDGHDLLAKLFNMPQGISINGISAWKGETGAGAQTLLSVAVSNPRGGGTAKRDISPASRRMLDGYAAARGLLLNQEAVVYHHPIYGNAKKNDNGVSLVTNRSLTQAEVAQFYNLVRETFGTDELAPAYRPDGLRVLNFTDIPNEKFHDGMEHVVAQLSEEWGDGIAEAGRFQSVGDYISNDWKENPHGESYLEKIAAVSRDLPRGLADLQARVDEVNQTFAKRYGWGAATRAEARASRGAKRRGAAEADVAGRSGATAQDLSYSPKEASIVNPIDPNLSAHEKVAQLNALTAKNQNAVQAYLRRLDRLLGTESKDSVKLPERIIEKASRPIIKATKPWHDVEHIRDSYRFKTVINDVAQLNKIIAEIPNLGAIVKPDLEKMLHPKEFGWRIAVFDLRLPNGQLVEHYMTLKELEAAKKNGGHQLFEMVRNLDLRSQENRDKYNRVVDRSWAHYSRAFDGYLQRTHQSVQDVREKLNDAWATVHQVAPELALSKKQDAGDVAPEFAKEVNDHWEKPGPIQNLKERFFGVPVYHGTSSDVAAIVQKSGLQPTSGGGTVFFTSDRSVAESYARYSSGVSRGAKPVLLSISLPKGVFETALKYDYGDKSYTIQQAIDPSWIKSAEDIALSKKQKPLVNDSAVGLPPEETKLQAFQRKAQDKFNRMEVIQRWAEAHGATLTPAANVYTTEERMYGRMATRMEDFREKTIKPLVERVQKAGYTMEQVAEVLHAQHAEERNVQIAKVNPAMQDGGSGMKTADAKAIMAKTPAKLLALANEFQAITKSTTQVLLNAGIINKEMVDAWTNAYKHYVPLKGGPEEKAAKTGSGPGLSVVAKNKRALGHSEREESIIENIMLDHERAIMSAEKNRVGQSMLLFATQLNNPQIIQVDKPVKRAVLKPKHQFEVRANGLTVDTFDTMSEAQNFVAAQRRIGAPGALALRISKSIADQQVQYMASPMLAENEAQVYVNGHAIRLQINDDILAREYKNLGVERLNKILSIGRTVQTFLSRAYTGYNPSFIARNAIRDFGSGTVKIGSNFGPKILAKTWSNYPTSLVHLLRYSWAGHATPDITAYREAGGSTGAAWLSDIERLGRDVTHTYERYEGVMAQVRKGKKLAAARVASQKTIGALVGWIEHLNMATENAMRLALFRAMRATGHSVEEAASAAKNSTVNFNRKGELGAQMSALYLFYNPNAQDTASVINSLTRGPYKAFGWSLLAGMASLAYLLAKMQWGGDDDDFERWKKIPDSVRDKNLIFRTGKDSYIKIPIPFGFGFFHTLGNTAFALEKGDTLNEASVNVAANFLDHFSPLGNPLTGAKGWDKVDPRGAAELVPGVGAGDLTRDAARLIVNRNAFGGNIVPDSKYDEDRPDFLKVNRVTKGTIYDAIARGLSGATGGTPATAGAIDMSPETLKFWTNAITGGTGTFLSDMTALGGLGARALANPGDPNLAALKPEPSEIPILKDYFSVERVGDQRRAYWDAAKEAQSAITEFRRAQKADDQEGADAVQRQHGEVMSLAAMSHAYGKSIKALRDDVEAINADQTKSLAFKRAAIKSMEREEGLLYDEFLHTFIESRRLDQQQKK